MSTGWICGFAPTGWHGSTSLDLVSADWVLQVVAHLDRLDRQIDLDAYTDTHESILFDSLDFSTISATATTPILAGQPTRARIVAWKHSDGQEITTLLLTVVFELWGVRGSASAPTPVFADRLAEMVGVLSELTFPFTSTSVWSPNDERIQS